MVFRNVVVREVLAEDHFDNRVIEADRAQLPQMALLEIRSRH